MKKFNLNNLDQDVYYFTLANGFKVYLVPFSNKKNFYAVLGTRYGSKDIDFSCNGDIHSPYGIAHFLEHKMFEQKDSKDPFTLTFVDSSLISPVLYALV